MTLIVLIVAISILMIAIAVDDTPPKEALNDKLHHRYPDAQPGDIRYCEEFNEYVTLDAHNNWIKQTTL